MGYVYADRKRADRVASQTDAVPAQPLPDALRSGAAQPTAEQMGHRVDLPDAMREKMESAFGADLSAVRLYESEAVANAGANAITQGSNIAFAPGMLDFTSFGGQALLGHEISHVVSQARGEVTGGGFLNDRALEARADREGAIAAAGQTIAMPPAAVSTASAAPVAGPMQARKAKSKDKLLADGFDMHTGAKDVRRNVSRQESQHGAHNLAFASIYGTSEQRGTRAVPAEANISGSYFTPNEYGGRTVNYMFPGVEDGGTAEQDTFQNSANQNNIVGNIYRPGRQGNGKSVVIFSGSGGSNQDQVGGDINQYLSAGYTVYAYDYGGFGGSTTPDNKVSERSMQEDADAMLQHVNSLGVKNKDILLHGFSMGGNMASHVARNAAIRAEKSGNDDDKLSGMVLESAMRSTKNSSQNTMDHFGRIAGTLASSEGEFDTEANLKELASLDKDMPITVISGDSAHGDYLSKENTGIEQIARRNFNNVNAVTATGHDHMSKKKLIDTWKDVKDNLHRK